MSFTPTSTPIPPHPPPSQYIRKLIFSDLHKDSLEHIVRQLRKLPWKQCEPYLVRCLLRVHRVRFGRLPFIAALVAALSRFHDSLAVAVVDQVRGWGWGVGGGGVGERGGGVSD